MLALLMTMSVLVSCGGGDETESESKQETQGTDNPVVTDPAETEVTDDLGDINFKNNENPVITFFLRDGYVWETYVEELTDNVLHDQIYWRNQEVQQRLGIEIAQIAQGCGWSSASGKYTEWNETLRNAVQTETHDFDAAMIYTGVSSSLGIEGVYMELSQLDKISLEKPWWNQNLMKEATIYGSLYFASGSIAMSQLRDANLMWYNKDMYKEFVAPTAEKDIYQVVRDGEWTIDYMYDMVANIWEDNDSNGEMSSGDTVGFVGAVHGSNGAMDSWLYALGCDLTKIDESIGEPVACFYNEHTVQAFEKARHFFVDNPGAYVVFTSGEGTGDTGFSNGNAMITLGRFSGGEGMGDYTFSYGILPVPKYDAEQDFYYSWCSSQAHTPLFVPRNSDSTELEKTANIIEGMAYFSKYMTGKTQSLHDAFYQNMADAKLCLTVNDRNMLALIFEQRTFDLDHVLNISNTCNVVANVAKGTSTSLPSSLATIQVKMTDPDEKINPLKIFLNEMNSKY